MDRGAWRATVHGVTKSWTRLSDFAFIFHCKGHRFALWSWSYDPAGCTAWPKKIEEKRKKRGRVELHQIMG